jgi:hypothetical protein
LSEISPRGCAEIDDRQLSRPRGTFGSPLRITTIITRNPDGIKTTFQMGCNGLMCNRNDNCLLTGGISLEVDPQEKKVTAK